MLRSLPALALAASVAACGAEETESFMTFCTEVAMADCSRGATPVDLCNVDAIQRDCSSLQRDGAWDAVQCMPPTSVEADNCLNRLVQFGGGTPFEAIEACAIVCPDGFFE